MPTYDYTCQECSHKLEKLQKITDSPLIRCPLCGKDSLKRGPGGGIGLSFQGTGFYITDYTKKNTEESAKKTCSSESCKEGCSKK